MTIIIVIITNNNENMMGEINMSTKEFCIVIPIHLE